MDEETFQKTLQEDEGIKETITSLTALMRQHTKLAKKGDETDKKIADLF